MPSHPGTAARSRKPISSITVVQEFTLESIAELASLSSSRMQTGHVPQDTGQLDAFYYKLLEDARASIVGLPNRPVLAPLSESDLKFNYLPQYPESLDCFDPFSVLPHASKWVSAQQKPLITYCRRIHLHNQI
jgi:hypothetical protein